MIQHIHARDMRRTDIGVSQADDRYERGTRDARNGFSRLHEIQVYGVVIDDDGRWPMAKIFLQFFVQGTHVCDLLAFRLCAVLSSVNRAILFSVYEYWH